MIIAVSKSDFILLPQRIKPVHFGTQRILEDQLLLIYFLLASDTSS